MAKTKFKENFKEILKELRKKKKLTQRELAEKTGISLAMITKYEQGLNTPSIENLRVLADFFKVPIREFLEDRNSDRFFKDFFSEEEANIDIENYDFSTNDEKFLSISKGKQFIYHILKFLEAVGFEIYIDEEKNVFEYNQNIKKVNDFIKKGKFEKAKNILEEMKRLHRMGYYELGKYYYFCEGDLSKAESNLYIAFENGVVKAGYYLGRLEEESGNVNLARNWYVTSFNFSEESVMKLFYFAIREQNFWAIDGYFYYLLQYAESAKNLYEFAKYYFWRNDAEKIKEIQNKLLNESQILYLTKEILYNVECMLGDEKSREYIKFVENAKNLEKLGEIEKAEKFYKRSIEYSEYGNVELAKYYGKFAEFDKYEKLKRIFKNNFLKQIRSEASYQLGKYSEHQNNLYDAINWYEISAKNENYKSFYKLSKLQSRKFSEAETNLHNNYFKYLKSSADLGYARAMIEMAFDSHLNSLESFEMAEKILTQNNIFELTKAIMNKAKMIYFGNEIKEVLEINYEEENMNTIKMLFENEKKRNNKEIGEIEYSITKNNLQRNLEIIEEEGNIEKQQEKQKNTSSNLLNKLKNFFGNS